MKEQQLWRIKMAGLFLSFIIGGVLLPFIKLPVLGFCIFEYFFGIPCPFCGIRTSIYYFIKGQWYDSFNTNIFGPLILLECVALFTYFCFTSLFKKEIEWSKEIKAFKMLTEITFYMLVFQWIIKLNY